jgi:hypothetical protein
MLGCGWLKNLIPNLVCEMHFKLDLQLPQFWHIAQIPWSFEDLLFRQAIEQSRLEVADDSVPLMVTSFEGGRQCFRCSRGSNKRGPHVWHGRPDDGGIATQNRPQTELGGGEGYLASRVHA